MFSVCVCECVCAGHIFHVYIVHLYSTVQEGGHVRELWASPNTCLLLVISLCSYVRTSPSLHLPCRRSLAYSILADLVHHVRTQLTLNHLALAVELFSRNIHDDCLPTSIQIMSCKVCKKGMVMYVCTYMCIYVRICITYVRISVLMGR